VNMDVCLNKGNVKRLPELLDRFIALGVREFDLLHLIPFGSAWEEKHRDSLMYDIDEAMPYIQAALKRSEEPDLHIWFNRFPPPYLEGYEHLIQDPHKLHDEARGRFEEYELWLTRGVPLSCREPARCDRCYLQPFCDALDDTLTRLDGADFDALRVRPGDASWPAGVVEEGAPAWVVAGDVTEALSIVSRVAERPLILQLDDYSALDAAVMGRIVRAVAATPAQAETLLALEADFEVTVRLDQTMAAWLQANYPDGHLRLALALPSHDRASDSERQDPDLQEFFSAYTAQVPVEGVPTCITGRATRPRLRVLDVTMLRTEAPDPQAPTPGDTGGRTSILKALSDLSIGDPAKDRALRGELSKLGALNPLRQAAVPDLFGYADHYIRDRYQTKSHRCRTCRFDAECEGLHINYVRAHGYVAMQPVTA